MILSIHKFLCEFKKFTYKTIIMIINNKCKHYTYHINIARLLFGPLIDTQKSVFLLKNKDFITYFSRED